MKFTDLFIKRPVLAATVSLLILVLGLRAVTSLPIRQYPKTESATIVVQTVYYGANAQTMAGFITQPLEQAIAQAQGIDYMTSSSTPGVSLITATLRLNYDGNKALTEISALVNSVKNQLPQQAQQPVITLQTGEQVASMYLGFSSKTLPSNKITDYLTRVVQPQLSAVEGVQSAEIIGARTFALRAWLDPVKMAAHGVTATDVNQALAANNFLSAIGTTKGQMVSVNLTAATDLHTVDEFKNLVVKADGADIVRLRDVADVTLGAESYNTDFSFDGQPTVAIGIKAAPDANVLDVIGRVRRLFPQIQSQLPTGLSGRIAYDGTDFIRASIDEVVKTLAETLIIVTVVIFLFLGTLRSVLIPVLAMPLSLIGAFVVMLILGYSINLLTLLALVLAIGLVVDDAIIVVENVDRHMKDAHSPFKAALLAARELASPIIAMTIVLIAVYVPVGFQGGLTGALFTEFAFTLAGAVVISAIVALTLSPMLCSKVLRESDHRKPFVKRIDKVSNWVRDRYRRTLHSSLDTWLVAIVFGALILAGNVYLFRTASSELAPQEDQGIVLAQTQGPPDATITQMDLYTRQIFDVAKSLPEYTHTFQFTGMGAVNSGFSGIMLKPWGERSRSATEIQQAIQPKLDGIAGARMAVFQFPSLPGAFGMPVQFVIKTTEPLQNLDDVAQQVLAKAQASGMFFFVDSDLKIDQPQATVTLDRDKVAALGLTQQSVGAALSAALGGNYVNYFSISGRAYRVISQVAQVDRLNPAQLENYYIKTPTGGMIPASTVAHLTYQTVPESINHFQQLNSATISGVIVPGVSLGSALAFMQDTLKQVAPTGYTADYAGESRQFQQESGGFLFTLLFAIVIVFLALSAQFESFRDPLVILVAVPMATFGALLFINLGLSTLNIYTEVGLVTLVGLISKHGILMVEFANQLQREHGLSKREAIEEAATVRLRPILMTTLAMVLGVVPLVFAGGAGAAGRHDMGLVIFTGLSIGTLFTLFVVPAVYLVLGESHKAERSEGDEDPEILPPPQPAE
ncbi:MAG: efflux RND transporter permease subunit [Xanthomonadaceae bacterium]|nr:efflux RND transporter permease subunit [Xanthomonadaceae bacterium]MDE2179076.1 efflux RND transporter permease subunit [Xanthomonadaceae bacterium]MDE2245087.1 efflux RND transporter permease subunit [Xanthomonadaceae bacterium]